MNKTTAPNKHLMALSTFLMLVPLVYFIPGWISPYLPDSKFIQVVVAVAIIVLIISYIANPIITKIIKYN